MTDTAATAAAPEIAINVKDLVRTYHIGEVDVHALNGVSFTVRSDEFVAIMGQSGSGKSTLMNQLGCLDTPTSGIYELYGRNVAKLSRNERATLRNQTIGFVFQNYSLLPRTTALENVELPLLYAGIPRKERHVRAIEALKRVDIFDRADHTPAQMSGGQQQRVAIARALVTRPKLLLADEPTGNLDTATSLDVMALLQELHGSGLCVVLITHEADISQHAQRRIVLRDGVVTEDGPVVGRMIAVDEIKVRAPH